MLNEVQAPFDFKAIYNLVSIYLSRYFNVSVSLPTRPIQTQTLRSITQLFILPLRQAHRSPCIFLSKHVYSAANIIVPPALDRMI